MNVDTKVYEFAKAWIEACVDDGELDASEAEGALESLAHEVQEVAEQFCNLD